MTANSHYTITYRADTSMGACGTNVGILNAALIANGKIQYPDTSGSSPYVDLVTVYFTKDTSGSYPNPPEKFILQLANSGGFTVEPIYTNSAAPTATVVASQSPSTGAWKLTITGPTQDETTDFQLYTGPTPPEKLKIRVKRQESFNCSTGPFDYVWGGEIIP